MENAELGLSTDFSLKTERSISITATDGEGKTQKGVKMGIFASQPYTGEANYLCRTYFCWIYRCFR